MPSTRRRRFLESLTAAPLLPAALTQAQPAAAETASPAALARHLGEVVRARYGQQLGAGDLEEVTRLIGESLEGAEKLRAVKLTNADEPVTLFSARPQPAPPGVGVGQPTPPAAGQPTPPAAQGPTGGRP